ncbi:hypothetical protein P8452_59411 [Trifolium repens]|nr:hypothetical protein P8452_59411 [Trifolium repens]
METHRKHVKSPPQSTKTDPAKTLAKLQLSKTLASRRTTTKPDQHQNVTTTSDMETRPTEKKNSHTHRPKRTRPPQLNHGRR